MPLYEYQCTKCKHRFEKIQKFSDPEIKKCPECGSKVEKLLSAPAVQFKGSGWYVTDYAKKTQSSSSSSDGGKDSKDSKESKESKESKKDEKKSDSSKESTNKKAEKNK